MYLASDITLYLRGERAVSLYYIVSGAGGGGNTLEPELTLDFAEEFVGF